MNGVGVDAGAIPLVDDGAVHRLRVVMGTPIAAGPGRRQTSERG
jgi:hypothetical protein